MNVERPTSLPASLEERWRAVAARVQEIEIALPESVAASAGNVLLVSDFVLSLLERRPDALAARVADGESLSAPGIAGALSLDGLSEPAAMAALRRFRNLEMARIAWRDLAGCAALEQSLSDLSTLAVGLVGAATRYAADALEPRYGRPVSASGGDAPLLVLAMGKLGGAELNFSSDIDLVFLYPDDAVLGDLEHAELAPYYLRVAQLVIKLLDQTTPDGFVYRLDTRLRPFGASGPLVIGLSAFESYLVSHGRDWERYAYQKARLITGDAYENELFDEILFPYVYRGYVDYGVFEALRQMKGLIEREVARRDMADNIKLGPGGIREVEFIVQAFQLVRGGRDRSLRGQSLMPILPRLVEERQLSSAEVAGLKAAYRFLRCLENRLQAMDDRQTHTLPAGAEPRARLAYAMQLPDWPTLLESLALHRASVEAAFDKVVYEPRTEQSEASRTKALRAAWEQGLPAEEAVTQLPQFDAESVELLRALRTGALYERMDEQSRLRLAAVIVRTLPLLADRSDQAAVLRRLLPIYQAICRRSAYLALLDEHPAALERLIVLVRRSARLSRDLAEHPVLLDELLDPRIFDAPPRRDEARSFLERQLAQALDRDTEAALNALRESHAAAVFRIAVADTFGQLPLMSVSDRLTDTAELTVRFALELARRELVGRHGRPICGDGPTPKEAGFAVIAYGKLAGLELGYGSDLDLVFLHDSRGAVQQTDGEKPLDNGVFFVRLAQRLIHFLSIQTSAGKLYEVDTRLRPSGNSGLLVQSLDNFKRYQRQDAWVWEHQALLRSRAIAGTREVCAGFEAARREILATAVDRDKLQTEVVNMRKRMRQELSKSGPEQFDLKQDRGGLADIEFIVDYLVLANLPDVPDLADFPDKVRQLEALERAGLLTAQTAAKLKHAYLALRQRGHDLALDAGGRVIADAELSRVRRDVRETWEQVFA